MAQIKVLNIFCVNIELIVNGLVCGDEKKLHQAFEFTCRDVFFFYFCAG